MLRVFIYFLRVFIYFTEAHQTASWNPLLA